MNKTLTVVPATNRPDLNVTLVAACTDCGNSESVDVSIDAVRKYENGAFVQDAFPMLTPEQREFYFMSGMCATCWDRLFPDED